MGSLLGDLTLKLPGGATAKAGQDTLKLAVNGKTYEGWQQINVKRSMKAISGSFDLRVVDKWAEEQVAWAIVPGDECRIEIGDDTIITGYVDSVSPRFDRDTREISVSGRDKTGDLVDCSTEDKAFTNTTFLDLLKKLAEPFGIQVKVDSGISISDRFPNFTTQGDTIFDTMEKAARQVAVLLMNDGAGNILVTRAGKTRATTALIQGENILSADADYDFKERFSKYTVKSQFFNPDGAEPAVDFSSKAVVTDANVKRHRPLLIKAETGSDSAKCQRRAKWEAAVRTGRSLRVNVTVPGWRQSDGELWTVNRLARVDAPWLGINMDLLITEVTFQKGEATTTQLTLEPASAYQPDPRTKENPYRQLVLQESKRK